REPRGDDQRGPRPQQLEAGLISDFHAAARHERDPAAQVCQLAAFREIQLRARRAQLVVEVMDRRVLLLADIARLRLPCLRDSYVRGLIGLIGLIDIAWLESLRREDVRRME